MYGPGLEVYGLGVNYTVLDVNYTVFVGMNTVLSENIQSSIYYESYDRD